MRLAQHSVQLPNNEQIITDWLWIDYHDRINVLVEAPTTTNTQEVSFLILEQTKYALDSTISLSVVGGIIEPTTQTDDRGQTKQIVLPEAPLMAAQREVEEEMGVRCTTWIPLGKFRTDVNRGMGWVNPFLARDCSYSKNVGVEEHGDVVGGADTEKQRMVVMSLEDVKKAVMEGRFLEVQWSNTVALAILRY
jgi:8-oxo-dGTP pyrophosphatase MutT (NUDIX family)